jgi:tetratricopeptide (TPR) repeat protein
MILFGAGSPALAQEAANVGLQRQVDDAFRQVLAAPASVDIGLRYARLQVENGDFEGGIAALERLLLAPNAPATLRLELGVLYYRLGSYGVAETYFRAAAADPALDPASKKQAETLLADVLKRGQPSQWSGFVMFGLRGQTNPMARTDERFLLAGGQLVPRTSDQKIKSDGDFQFISRIDHKLDLETQNNAALVSSLTAVASHYSTVDSYQLRRNPTKPRDLALVEATSGINFQPDPTGTPTLTVRPHVIVGGILLDGHTYSGNIGLGLDAGYRINERTLLEATYELRRYSYESRIDVVEARQQGGAEHTLRLRASRELAPGQFLIGEVVGRDHQADRDYFAYRSGEVRLTYGISYKNPLGWDERSWTTSLAGGFLVRDYRGADPLVAATRGRTDREIRTTLSNTVPISDAWSMVLQFEYANADSQLPNYRYDNLSASASVIWRF